MQLQYEFVDSTMIVKLIGELDHHVAEKIRIELDDMIIKKRVTNLVLDFSKTAFMDSSGIGVIIGRYKNISQRGGKVAVVRVSEKIDQIFRLAGIYRIVKKYDNKKEALYSM